MSTCHVWPPALDFGSSAATEMEQQLPAKMLWAEGSCQGCVSDTTVSGGMGGRLGHSWEHLLFTIAVQGRVGRCVYRLSIAVVKYPMTATEARKSPFQLTVWRYSPCWQGSRRQAPEASGRIVPTGSRDGYRCSSRSYRFAVQGPSHRMTPSTLGCVFPSPMNQSQNSLTDMPRDLSASLV